MLSKYYRSFLGREKGISEDMVFKGGVTVSFTSTMDKKGPLRGIKVGSKTSPGIKATGKVSDVDLNSWWPYSQKSDKYIMYIHYTSGNR